MFLLIRVKFEAAKLELGETRFSLLLAEFSVGLSLEVVVCFERVGEI